MMQIFEERIIKLMSQSDYKPMKIGGFEAALNVHEAADFKMLVKAVVELEGKGQIIRTKKDSYILPKMQDLIKGKVAGNSRGFAFIIPEEDGLDDIYVAANDLNSASHGDIVLVRVKTKRISQKREGVVEKIITRAINRTVGTYEDHKLGGIVILDDKRISGEILIAKGETLGAVAGHKVVIEITDFDSQPKKGKVTEILGHANDPGVDILSIIHKHGLPQDFPDDVMNQANKVPDKIAEGDLKNRRDLRNELIITIDGADAKDLDDAVTVTKLENGNYRLGVHIADVSHYVTAASPIDREAVERGTSIYLVDRVIPMIPHRLSNGICSLNPRVDRLTLSCEMEIDEDGKVVSHEIFQSVINTTERMTYSDVNEILANANPELIGKYQNIGKMLTEMEELAAILRAKRTKRGAIDFDFAESKIIVDEEGNPTEIALRERGISERLIEEFMLAANETVAEHFHWLELPFMYRIHEEPREEKLKHFFEFILNFGLIVRGVNEINPGALQKILEEVEGQPEEAVVSKLMLRSMKQAKYDPESLGHFGLATDFYTHFTSPIRRYPDLIVHRLIRTYLIEKDTSNETIEGWDEVLGDIADHCSTMERRAVDAERETDNLKKCEYMIRHIGEEFTGIISSVTNFGMFIELPNTIEGLVHVSNLTDDYYNYDAQHCCMIGERTAKVFRIGDEVSVIVEYVNLDERTIDFKIVGMKGSGRPKPSTRVLDVRKEKPFENKWKKKSSSDKSVSTNKRLDRPRRKKPEAETESSPRMGIKKAFYENIPASKRNKKRKK